MKTNSKSKSTNKFVDHSGHQNTKHNTKHGQKNRKNSFFRDIAKSDNKPQAHDRKKGHGLPNKNGSGVQKTVNFKPKRGHGNDSKKHAGNRSFNNSNSRSQKGHFAGKKRIQEPAKPTAPEYHFQSKPEKVNLCLAPDRLEAQAKAIKHFERQERAQELETKKQDRNMKHKMMTQKTRKGQPVMQGRLELLFEKVKKVVGV
ncbi:uncharacterized protein LOC128725715 [Anopheles nili]|uniref:uncharacterized protein LOC128725715 n=1 Tax=Anopheles nili TaxID=185578 RepID=UPI00237A2F90|nr:uncharacterized protein LOC128725715 [Anopheles nili]